MSEDWNLQLSVKIEGQHLLNLRSETSAGLSAMLAWAVENREAIIAATAALEGAQKPPPAVPVYVAPRVAPSSPGGLQGEIGPVAIEKVDVDTVKKDGTRMNSPKFTVKFSNGKRHSTFDSLVGDAASALHRDGSSVYYSIKVNGEYQNLAAIRKAG